MIINQTMKKMQADLGTRCMKRLREVSVAHHGTRDTQSFLAITIHSSAEEGIATVGIVVVSSISLAVMAKQVSLIVSALCSSYLDGDLATWVFNIRGKR